VTVVIVEAVYTLATEIAAAVAIHPVAIPDQENHSRPASGIVVNQENYALAGRLRIHPDREKSKSDYTGGHRTDPGMVDYRCCKHGSVGD
jgi:hypothetical protein